MPRFRSPSGPLALFALLAGLLPLFAQPIPPAPAPGPAPPRLAVQKARVGATAAVVEPTVSDEDALKEAGLTPTDGEKLVGYLKQRTVSDAEQGKIQELIKKFKADNFDERLTAAEHLELYGPAAIGPLKTAEKDSDPEVSYQAGRILKRLEKIPHSAAAAAAVRAVVRLKPPGAATALLGFLPLADSETLADEIRGALVALAAPDGKPDPGLVAALADPSAIRRGAAYVALIEGGPAGERIRIKESFQQVKDAVRKDTDPDAKFRGLWALVLTTKEKEFVPDLIGLIPQLTRGRIWQLEDLLLQLSGAHPEGTRFGKSAESLARAKDAWATWWEKKGGGVDLTKLDFKPRVLGFTDLVESDQRGFGMGRVASLGPDMKEKWQLVGLRNATDAHVLPDGHVLLVENYTQIIERDATGRQVSIKIVNQPLSAHPLSGGGLLVVCRQMVIEYDKQNAQVWSYMRPVADIIAGRRLPGGDTVFVTAAPQGPNCFRLDAKGKMVGQGVTIGRLQNQGVIVGMDVIGEETILVCEFDRVAEYDLKTGKLGWKHPLIQPTSVQRLSNGNTLIASLNMNRAVEVDPTGEVVWEYQATKDGLRVSRAYRR
ncbi:MAG: enzyme repeat protein [Gemmataceae bacterium]|nr:enzyme repeat protein [Gemmataceae bacterium]